MNFSKFSLLSTFALLATLTVCYAKDAKEASKPGAVVAEESKTPSDDTVTKADGIKNDKPDGASTEGGTSDFDIEQLLKLIDALKNQDFDEVDRTLKDSKMDVNNDEPINPAIEAEKKAADKKRFNEKMKEEIDTSSTSDIDEKDEL